MKFIADIHTHSIYSRATSKQSDLAGFYSWAKIKGIHLVGTGDFTQPDWFDYLRENLVDSDSGFFALKDEPKHNLIEGANPEQIPVRFVLTSEISCIYKKGGKVRKVHLLMVVPDFQSAQRIGRRLGSIGNVVYDGRPILGLDAKDLLEIMLEEAPGGFMVPAHIWTPWFSLFGSKSGFDSVEECFEDLSGHIFALETGLSADPEMIRHVSALDRFTLISNSDCHSPSNLGREVNLFDCAFDFPSFKAALQDPKKGYSGTVEFYPEGGKYYGDGHRKCGIAYDYEAIFKEGPDCPVCKKSLTLGVMRRISELADRKTPQFQDHDPGYFSLVPLPEVLSELLSVGPKSKKVNRAYLKLIERFGSEFTLLLHTPIEEIKGFGSEVLAEAIRRIRAKEVIRTLGYDGVYGSIRAFKPGELESFPSLTIGG